MAKQLEVSGADWPATNSVSAVVANLVSVEGFGFLLKEAVTSVDDFVQ